VSYSGASTPMHRPLSRSALPPPHTSHSLTTGAGSGTGLHHRGTGGAGGALLTATPKDLPRSKSAAAVVGGVPRSTRLRPQGLPPHRATGVSFLEDAKSHASRKRRSSRAARRTQDSAAHPAANQHAQDAAQAVAQERQTLSPGLVERFQADRLWHLRELDSLAPAGRMDALQLRAWLTTKCVVACPDNGVAWVCASRTRVPALFFFSSFSFRCCFVCVGGAVCLVCMPMADSV